MVFLSVLCADMDISLDNPGFLMDVSDQVEAHQSDVPLHASGSSSSGEATRRSCSRCHGRMSSLSLDRHLFCVKCRGADLWVVEVLRWGYHIPFRRAPPYPRNPSLVPYSDVLIC